MFMLLTTVRGLPCDCDISSLEWSQARGWISWADTDGKVTSVQTDSIARVELYPSRDAALVDGADVRDYPGWGSD